MPGEEEVANLCTEQVLSWSGRRAKVAGHCPFLPCSRDAEHSQLQVTPALHRRVGQKRLMSCLYGRGDLGSLILKVPVPFLPCLSPAFFL